jgi:hypothetical protein
LPLLLELTDGEEEASRKALLSASVALLPLLLSATVGLLEFVQSQETCERHCHSREYVHGDTSSFIGAFEQLIDVNRAVTACFMSVQLFSNVIRLKVQELYGSKNSLSRKNKRDKKGESQSASVHDLADDDTFSDEMVAEFLGISPSMSDVQLLMRFLVACRDGGDRSSEVVDSDDENDTAAVCDSSGTGAGTGAGVAGGEFEREVLANKDILRGACGELCNYFRNAFSPQFFR